MFKKHKFQQTEYSTKLDNDPFYKYFDKSLIKILKRRKTTKEFLNLYMQLPKKT